MTNIIAQFIQTIYHRINMLINLIPFFVILQQYYQLYLIINVQINLIHSPVMIQRQKFTPDIQIKYHQIVSHMHEKNKVIEQFSRVLKDLCDWQMFNSKNLDKFANSISKLLVGKDPLKDTFIIFERILASKSDQANKIAVSIKQDMLPFLQSAINIKSQTFIKNQQQQVKDLKLAMHQKIRQLYSAEVNYKTIHDKIDKLNNSNILQSRQKIEELTKIKRELMDAQTYLTEVINIYNHTVEDYMLNYSKLCQQLSEIESNRKITIKESISKYIVFEMDAIKNIEYDLCRHAKSIEKMEDKLIIQEKWFAQTDSKAIQLAKISSTNYISHLVNRQSQTQTPASFQTDNQKKINQIKKFLDPLKQNFQLNKNSFSNLVDEINQILSDAIEIFDMKTVKQIVHYSTNFYSLSSLPKSVQNSQKQIQFRRTKIPLINAILCHPIFTNEAFWQKYSSRLADIVEKEVTTLRGTRKKDELKISLSLLSTDIEFMKKISSSAIVQRILNKYLQHSGDSSEQILKSTDSIKLKSQSSISKQNAKQKQKTQNKSYSQQQKQCEDLIYF